MDGRALVARSVRFGAPLVALIAVGVAIVAAQERTLTVVVTGQTMIQADLRVHTPQVASLKPALSGDAVFTNFECSVVEPDQHGPGPGLPPNTPSEGIDSLMALGFNMLAFANNHAADFGGQGIQTTIKAARTRNLTHAGTGNTLDEATAPGYLKTPKGTVALVALASGAIQPGKAATPTQPGPNELRVEGEGKELKPNAADHDRILQSVREAAAHADLVMVSQHNHVFEVSLQRMFLEKLPERFRPPDWIVKWAHELVDAGGDVIVLHGGFFVRGVEVYRDRPIFYDTGSFVFQYPKGGLGGLFDNEPYVWESVIPRVTFAGKTLQSITFRPIVLNRDGSDGELNTVTRGVPSFATHERARAILNHVADISRPFGTVVEVKGESAEVRLKK